MKAVGKSLLNWVGVAFYNFLDNAINMGAINDDLWVFPGLPLCHPQRHVERGECERRVLIEQRVLATVTEHPAKTSVLLSG